MLHVCWPYTREACGLVVDTAGLLTVRNVFLLKKAFIKFRNSCTSFMPEDENVYSNTVCKG